MKTIKIEGINFELQKHTVTEGYVSAYTRNMRDLWYYYNKPSKVKQEIYKEWVSWACFYADYYGVTSANCNCFTFSMVLTHNGKKYIAVITKAHNRLYEVE